MTVTVDFDTNPRTFYAPAATTVKVRFTDKSTTDSGVINAWSWWVNDGSGLTPVSNDQNPVVTLGPGTYDVKLIINDSGDTGPTDLTRNDWIIILAGTFTPPSQVSAYRNITLFVYERSSETTPVSACICRAKTSTCNLFYQNLHVEGALTKSGKATFDIVNSGGTAPEIDLFESSTIGRYKNIAIIAGYDVIWSGKITESVKSYKSQPGTTPQKTVYTCEAYSDIKKLTDWNIVTPGSLSGAPGQILEEILTINTGEPDFIGTRGGYIDPQGFPLEMILTDTDKYSAFTNLTNVSDYDWRTRMETMVFQYATFNGTNVVTITSAGLTVSALVGYWLLFPTENYLKSGVSTPNRSGILAWGRITANTATTITATLSGASTVPLTLDKCLIVTIPRLDFSSDLAEPTALRTFTNNVNAVRFTNLDDKVDLFTKVIAKGKISGESSALSIVAKDAWNETDMQFENSTFITFSSEAYSYYFAPGTAVVAIKREGAWKVGDTVFLVYYDIGLEAYNTLTRTISGVDLYHGGYGAPAGDDTPTYLISLNSTPGDTGPMLLINSKCYLKDIARIAQAGTYTTVNIGAEPTTRTFTNALSGTDAVYGSYMCMAADTDFTEGSIYPHKAGCLVSNNTYSEAAPQTGSPIKIHGIITKSNTIDTTTSKPDLEVAATQAIVQGATYYQKSTMLVSYYQFCVNRVRDGVQLTGPVMIREGQRIAIIPYTGATPVERQVIIWNFDATTMVVTLTLGDYQKDVFNVINTNTAATQKTLI